MKGKPTWKPVGVRAKRWRDAGHSRIPINMMLPEKPMKEEKRRPRAPHAGAIPFEEHGKQ